jgi:glycosyltransferase involved in cell wall biosynthesis
MRVLFVVPSYYPRIGGVQKHVMKITERMIADGHCVKVIVVSSGNVHFGPRVGEEKVDRIGYVRSRVLSGIHSRANIARYLLRHLQEIAQYDVVHFHDYGTMWLWVPIGICMLALLRRRVFVTFHGWEGTYPPRTTVVAKRRICERIARESICVGAYIKKWYKAQGECITYGGVDVPTDPADPEEQITFIGRLERDTGILEYLEAWRLVRDSLRGMRLVICGGGSLRDFIEQEYGDSHERVQMVGAIEDPTRQMQMGRVILASGYLSILEGFAAKRPVVAFYDNPLKRDYLTMMPNARAMMWAASSIEEIAASIKSALEDTERTKLAFEFAVKNGWSSVVELYYAAWAN